MTVCVVQELDDAIGVTDDGMQSSSILFADVLKGPEAMSRPVPPGGPTGAGQRVLGLPVMTPVQLNQVFAV